MNIKKKQTVKKIRNITCSAIVSSVHDINNIVVTASNGRVIKIKIKPIKKEGNLVILVPKIGSTIVINGKNNGECIIVDAGLNCNEYDVIGVDESSGEYIVIDKDEFNDTVVDLNLE